MTEPRRLQIPETGYPPRRAPRISRREKPTPKPQSPPWVTVPKPPERRGTNAWRTRNKTKMNEIRLAPISFSE